MATLVSRFAITTFIFAGCHYLFFSSDICYATQSNGLVKIDGKHIKRLVLLGEHKMEIFTNLNESIKLPVGKYQISEIELQDNYICRQYDLHNLPKNFAEINVKENEAAVLKFGGPLTQSIKIERRGNSLLLNYKLQGIGGEDYSERQRNKAPHFAVYKGDVQIGSGTFAYG